MKKHLPSLLLIPVLALLIFAPVSLSAADQQVSASVSPLLEYKLISGFKQSFTDDLQFNLSKGWIPVGGVSVTSWNTNIYFAQLISKKAE